MKVCRPNVNEMFKEILNSTIGSPNRYNMNHLSNNSNSEKMFKITTVPVVLCPGKILQTYQADEISESNITGKFLVKTKDKEFNTTIYPFLQTDYLVDQLTGKAYHFRVG